MGWSGPQKIQDGIEFIQCDPCVRDNSDDELILAFISNKDSQWILFDDPKRQGGIEFIHAVISVGDCSDDELIIALI